MKVKLLNDWYNHEGALIRKEEAGAVVEHDLPDAWFKELPSSASVLVDDEWKTVKALREDGVTTLSTPHVKPPSSKPATPPAKKE